ncbi:hypothetical protein SAMN00777080_4226 [Aquiflexum balticum DSM 16537]|uniref:Uncharacterized protein n=1 Tax=Aquiflexum balticum DSM 16537 TaxID=758820 RepID=A0A1W2H9L4_9BACT|nr:DUF5695 domain-containing protein [Aquiflexum balticum]SMD45569.1 hypothetical protein SAMN00777080_4226 [Aquiflexum balticum DSM 16537]
MKFRSDFFLKSAHRSAFLSLSLLLIVVFQSRSQNIWSRIENRNQTLNVANQTEFNVGGLRLKILDESQTVAELRPNADLAFDFVPSELLEIRSRDSLYHLGDVNIMLRNKNEKDWIKFSTAKERRSVNPLVQSREYLSGSILNPTLGDDLPVEIRRFWEDKDGLLSMRFEIVNKSQSDVEIGYLGFPMVFDNILHRKNLEEAHLQKVFYDPYIGQDAGYLQVVRLSGKGPVLLVLPDENAGFEAYNPLLDDLTPRSITFEGFHDWVVHSKALAETEWENVTPWNSPTSIHLEPGAKRSVSFKFVLAEDVKGIEKTLISHHRPVAVGIPGYVIPMDVEGKLFLNSPSAIKEMFVEPENGIEINKVGKSKSGKWTEFQVNGKSWGRSRLTIEYENGEKQTIHYNVIKAETDVIADFGRFLTHEQWYENDQDLFGRHQSVISYDIEENAQVLEDNRAWIPGLSDEAGAGSWLAAMMKQVVNPEKGEMEKLSVFYHETLWGGIQYSEGPKKYGVRKSMFYYEPEKFPEGTYSKDVNYSTWAAWDQEQAESTVRSYNYPHVAAAHWVMYRLSRYHKNLVDQKPWDWYLENAYHTAVAMVEQAPHYAQYGQMEGTIFLMILKDLQREGMNKMAGDLEELMKKRTDVWAALSYPFGSEMPWDSTGQEEVYMWSDYFGFHEKSEVTLNAILAYMPTVPHWGYNGSARRYWDFVYGGKLRRIERQLHHYGSALNSIPVLSAYHKNPEDLYLLRVGYGGVLGGISNITQKGFGPAAFHSFPNTLKIDGYSGDYGSGFFGYAVNSRSYLVLDDELGWVGFGGNVKVEKDWVKFEIKNASRSAVWIGPEKMLLELDAGTFERVHYNTKTKEIELIFSPKSSFVDKVYLRQNDKIGNIYKPDTQFPIQNGAYVVELKNENLTIRLKK